MHTVLACFTTNLKVLFSTATVTRDNKHVTPTQAFVLLSEDDEMSYPLLVAYFNHSSRLQLSLL